MAQGTYEETHKRIIDSAYQFFLENGFERANLRDLCRDAGITTGALYRHFASKEELFSALVQPTVDELEKMYSQAETDIANRLRSDGAAQMWAVSKISGKKLAPAETRTGMIMELPPYHKPHWKHIFKEA